MPIRVLLADDHSIMREGLRQLLQRESDFEIVGEADNGRSAVAMAGARRPDVVIMDAAMPVLNGIDATRQIVENNRNIKVLALTVHSDETYLAGMLQAGASGYLLKDCASEELVMAARSVAADKGYVSPELAPLVLKAYAVNAATTKQGALSVRERKILKLIAEGVSIKEIASQLGVSYKTVNRDRSKMMERLGLFSVAELTKYAVRFGLTELKQH